VEHYDHENDEPLRDLSEAGPDPATSWRMGDTSVCAVPDKNGTFDIWIDHATPEQAIDATRVNDGAERSNDGVGRSKNGVAERGACHDAGGTDENGQQVFNCDACGCVLSLYHRDGTNTMHSRIGLEQECLPVEALMDMDDAELRSYDCVIVDEAQFCTKEQVERLTQVVDDYDIPVIAYGLRTDFQRNLFPGSLWLLAWADVIEEVKTVCWCGRKATNNARISGGKIVRSGDQVFMGGNESYTALCRMHFKLGFLSYEDEKKAEWD
jgi:thymidine kinase